MSDDQQDVATDTRPPFAPFPVWAACRFAATLGFAMLVFWGLWAINRLWAGGALPPIWIGAIGLILSGRRGYANTGTLPPLCEFVGRALAPKHCPACGQSIFNHTPADGYAADEMRYGYWPSRECTNCGADLTTREVAA